MCGGGVCMAGGHAWQGMGVAGGMHGRGVSVGGGAYVAHTPPAETTRYGQ